MARIRRTLLKPYNPKKCNTQQRAIEAARRLLSNNVSLLDSRRMDDCFEMGDSIEVIKHLLKILSEYGVKQYEDLGCFAQQYASKRWWIDERYK